MLDEVMTAMNTDLLGASWERIRNYKREIKEAAPEDLEEAARHIKTVLEDANLCMAGNKALLLADEDCFDEMIF